MKRVVICTSVHPHDDVRIFHKEAQTLAGAGYEVLLLNPEYGGERGGVQFVRVQTGHSRARRMAFAWIHYAKAALGLKPDICHLHDPELIPAGLWLARRGVKVVYDAHEDLPRQIYGKQWLAKPLRPVAAGAAAFLQRRALRRFHLVFCATGLIARGFRGIIKNIVTLRNYPALAEFPPTNTPREAAVCYVGALSVSRGALEMARAAALAGVPLYVAGRFETQDLAARLRAMAGVHYLGLLGRGEVAALLARCSAGLVTLHPTPAYMESTPIKLLEYMAAGLPAIASDFPHWRKLLGNAACARFVNPLDEHALAAEIKALAGAPQAARSLGENGRRAVEQRFCWEQERKKLLRGYQNL